MSDEPDDKDLFGRLGGTRAMAKLIDESSSTVQSWKVAGRIPATRQPDVFKKLSDAGKPVRPEELIWPTMTLPALAKIATQADAA